ncbi:MAG: M56 family metallopeptidase [Prevotella sp.]|nr:M56 family metallopeptidase [Prevotella sp.]
MTDFLIYDLKVAVLIAVFYIFYRLMLSHETFHRVNRAVLLLTAVASFVLPLCVITIHKTVMIEAVPDVAIGDIEMEIGTAEPATPLWQTLLPVLYVLGAAVTLGHTIVSMMKVILLIRRSERHRQPDGTIICVTGNVKVAPFSWMRYIVMSRGDYEAHDAAILAHEWGHIRLRHSWDVLLVNLLTALQWFNPAMWMLRQDLRSIHEYEADGEVLSQGINARQYQYLLISKATGIGGYSIANGISHSTLKKRIHMMINMKSKSSHLLKLLALVPIVGTALALNARTVTDYVYDEPQKQQPVKKGQKAGTISVNNQKIQVVTSKTTEHKDTITVNSPVVNTDDDKVFDVVDEMPQYPGGTSELMKYLSANIRYPKEAMENGEQGRVIVSFVVDKDGSINGAYAINSNSPQLEAEALRIVNSMPAWTPGKQNGEPVRVKFTMPIMFRLNDSNTPTTLINEVKQEGKKVTSFNYMRSINGETVEELTVKDDFDIMIDGVKTDKPMSEVLKELNPTDIESMKVDKSDPEKPVIKIITKKKK